MTDTVYVHVCDDTVWNAMIAAADIMTALQNHEIVTVDLLSESPTLDHTNLAGFLDHLASGGIDLNRIRIVTGNLLEDLPGPVIIKNPKAMWELGHMQKIAHTIPKAKSIQYHFGNFIGRCTTPRLILASHLYCNYKEKTLQTFHWDPASDYHKNHLGLEQLIHRYGTDSAEFQEAIDLLKASPLLMDTVKSYPMVFPDYYLELCSFYGNFFVDVVCETWYQGKNFSVTEKLWRAVTTKTPFILFGAQDMLQNLQKLGFKTFDRWWDEGYSLDPFNHNVSEIKKVLAHVARYSISDLQNIYQEMQPTLEHNFEVFLNLTYEDFSRISCSVAT